MKRISKGKAISFLVVELLGTSVKQKNKSVFISWWSYVSEISGSSK